MMSTEELTTAWNGRAAYAFRAAGGSHAVEAADGAENVTEEERLDADPE